MRGSRMDRRFIRLQTRSLAALGMTWVALGMTFVAATAGAQRASGTVRGADSVAISGAAVVVLDSAAREQRRVVTDEQGRYSIQLDRSAHSLRVTRIGYTPGA